MKRVVEFNGQSVVITGAGDDISDDMIREALRRRKIEIEARRDAIALEQAASHDKALQGSEFNRKVRGLALPATLALAAAAARTAPDGVRWNLRPEAERIAAARVAEDPHYARELIPVPGTPGAMTTRTDNNWCRREYQRIVRKARQRRHKRRGWGRS